MDDEYSSTDFEAGSDLGVDDYNLPADITDPKTDTNGNGFYTNAQALEVIKEYGGLVSYCLNILKPTLPNCIEMKDFHSEGLIHLLKASKRYDENHTSGANFKTYASRRIIGSMQDLLRICDTIYRSNREQCKQINDVIDEFIKEHDRYPHNHEFIKILINIKKIEKREYSFWFRLAKESLMPLSIDEEDEEGNSLKDFLKDESKDPFIPATISECLAILDARSRKIIELYYFEDITMKRIGKMFNISAVRISQIHDKALKKMRAHVQNS